jgi:hypothetical protein
LSRNSEYTRRHCRRRHKVEVEVEAEAEIEIIFGFTVHAVEPLSSFAVEPTVEYIIKYF